MCHTLGLGLLLLVSGRGVAARVMRSGCASWRRSWMLGHRRGLGRLLLGFFPLSPCRGCFGGKDVRIQMALTAHSTVGLKR
jgi:hypothetical protein